MQGRVTSMSRRMRLRGYYTIRPTTSSRGECQLCLDPPLAMQLWELRAFDTLGDWHGLVCRNCMVYARSLGERGSILPTPRKPKD